ncbi:hypothetical protein PIB30_073801 [Stylosanthes scabra]|uniref:Uncharacterized protein n=1 Tax=Stylosanthes scabra TaxID=79078 RepID=A0ABU6SPL2_9FABA|nr:hypothetical protein [Stylosanthes scabra]
MELSHADDQRRMSYPPAEEALKHLLWLADADAVYESALGLYDLNLAVIVSMNTKKDPKEFLPFLQELQQKPSIFSIVSSTFTNPAKKMPFLEAWGDYLSEEKCFEDAATIYLSCSCLDKALKSYRAINNWSGVLTIAGFLNLGKDEVLNLASELCEELQALGKPGEAAKIALECYEEIRNGRRLLLATKLQPEERAACDIDDDAASETSSNLSGMSAYTIGPDEEMALVEHLKGMFLTPEARRELKPLLVFLMMLGEGETARKLQHVAENFQLSQMAAVRLAEETMSIDTINEQAHTLEQYSQKVRSPMHDLEAFSW